jgi:hypothetical protein
MLLVLLLWSVLGYFGRLADVVPHRGGTTARWT